MDIKNFPSCPKCQCAMVPLSDFSKNDAEIRYKAWACVSCGHFVVLRGGDVYYGKSGDAK